MTHLARPVLTFNATPQQTATISVVPYCSDIVALPGCTFFGHNKFTKFVLIAFFKSGSILLCNEQYLTEARAAENAEAFKLDIIKSLT